MPVPTSRSARPRRDARFMRYDPILGPEARARPAHRHFDEAERERILEDFRSAVNMTPGELREWLETEQSQSVGWVNPGETESVGHRSGRRIVAIEKKARADLTDADYAHMRTVVGFVRRHLRQGGPRYDRASSRWRYSLMNWGHDPMKAGD